MLSEAVDWFSNIPVEKVERAYAYYRLVQCVEHAECMQRGSLAHPRAYNQTRRTVELWQYAVYCAVTYAGEDVARVSDACGIGIDELKKMSAHIEWAKGEGALFRDAAELREEIERLAHMIGALRGVEYAGD